MNNKSFNFDIPRAKQVIPNGTNIGDDLVLINSFEDVPLVTEPRKVHCFFVAICLEGSAQYTVDTKEFKVGKNDVVVFNDGQVIGNYMFSRDCKGVAIMVSNDFFAEIVKEVHEMSQLFLIAYSNPVFSLKPEKVRTFMGYFNLKACVFFRVKTFISVVYLLILFSLFFLSCFAFTSLTVIRV